jgi:hypothetical protein
LGVEGNLSAMNSPTASSAIFFELLAKSMRAGTEGKGRIIFSRVAQLTIAGAVKERKPATTPIPAATAGA